MRDPKLPRDQRLRILVFGYLVRGPLGGMAWHYLNYVVGLARLGHDVYYFEDSAYSEDSGSGPTCYDPLRGVMDTHPQYGLEFARSAFASLDLKERWARKGASAASNPTQPRRNACERGGGTTHEPHRTHCPSSTSRCLR